MLLLPSAAFCARVWVDLLEVVGMLAEGQAQGVQGVTVVFLGAEKQGEQVEGVQVVATER